ncbi:class I SAM-dependent methyltransferase [Marinomonas ostreistagni]|uniref:Class I SAM-dependent methyltransferase n=1 Tax=Marinomonas ostreistagni TaxID=359209 RepID=A0ABS0ZD13_9GAMM|nr:class I SAM-dependent methyltransferase [Marinomonas ostreistagni]MBJ7551512.1 class I SAM-dependent methyltransferase [Marinomonas ostreistagni]
MKPKNAPSSPVSFADPKLQEICNQHLRKQLNSLLNQLPKNEAQQALQLSLENLVTKILDTQLPHDQLVELFATAYENLLTSYQTAELTESEQTTSYLNATGLVMSVEHALHTFQDIYRVQAFIRGIHQALESKQGSQKIHIVYPACGPFAPLLLPLIRHYAASDTARHQLKVTLIDIQPGAIKALNKLISDLDISDYIHEVLCCDVMNYHPNHPIDVLVMEALQHGFTREGHLAFARHLAPYLTADAIMLPEKIVVTASLNVGQREFVDQWKDNKRTHSSLVDETIQSERVCLGEVFSLTLESLRKLTVIPLGDGMELIECNQVQVPKSIENIDKTNLLLCVTVTTFGQEKISEYDSGITHPLCDMSVCIDFVPKVAEPDDLLVKSGDRLKFYYKLSGAPGFLPTIA